LDLRILKDLVTCDSWMVSGALAEVDGESDVVALVADEAIGSFLRGGGRTPSASKRWNSPMRAKAATNVRKW